MAFVPCFFLDSLIQIFISAEAITFHLVLQANHTKGLTFIYVIWGAGKKPKQAVEKDVDS